MRPSMLCVALLVVCAGVLPAFAELQNVEVGGEIHMRGDYIDDTFTPLPLTAVRWPATILFRRPIGGPFAAGGGNGQGVVSIREWSDQGHAMKFVEQRTRLNVGADFTSNVRTFVEFDSYNMWGDSFRSDYRTGVDAAATGPDVQLHQAYIEADQMFDQPLRLRLGRQELRLGNEWLVGGNDFEFFFTGLSFDGMRLTYDTDLFTVDAFAMKLDERSPIEQDGDTDFYGLYGTYKGIENVTLDAYWMLVRDAQSLEDVFGNPVIDWVEHAFGVDDYDPTMLHTIGARAAGKYGPVDFDAQLAYQFGQADAIGVTFKPEVYGDDDAEFDSLGGTAEVGYSFDAKCHPRVFAGFVYLDGEDNRDITFVDLINPFYTPEASVSFNRLFSNVIYSGFMDLNKDLSNAYIIKAGAMAAPMEKLLVILMVSDFSAVEPFDAPRHFNVGRLRVPLFPNLPFLTQENSSHLGLETDIFMRYQYSEDLMFEAGWAHMFTGSGLEDGSYSAWNGLVFNGGSDDDDGDYYYLGSRIKF